MASVSISSTVQQAEPGSEQRLFVYGTLGPGRSHAHLLEELGGKWQKGSIRGRLFAEGIGLTAGYPVVDLNGEGLVEGHLFASKQLASAWHRLDAYEGAGYRRVEVMVRLATGETVSAYVYALDRKAAGN